MVPFTIRRRSLVKKNKLDSISVYCFYWLKTIQEGWHGIKNWSKAKDQLSATLNSFLLVVEGTVLINMENKSIHSSFSHRFLFKLAIFYRKPDFILTPYLHNHKSLGNSLDSNHSIHFSHNTHQNSLAWKRKHRYKMLLFLLQPLLKPAEGWTMSFILKRSHLHEVRES